MRTYKSFTLGLLIAIAVAGFAAPSARAGVEPSPFIDAFNLRTTGGLTNPGVLVGFNPQPEPPLATILGLSNPLAPTFTTDEVSAPTTFQVLFALSTPSSIFFEQLSAPDANGFGISAVEVATKVVLFNILFSFTTSSGGFLDPGSVVGFNPQPEPPLSGFVEGIGFDLELTSLSTATMTLQIQDADGNTLNFSEAPAAIPLPAALPLFLTGLAGLGIMRRRQRQKQRD